MKKVVFTILMMVCCPTLFSQHAVKTYDIAPVLSHFPVDFALLTHGDMQFVAYYDTLHRMTVASRHLSDETWTYQVLPQKIGWDSHNYIVMKLDGDGYLHLSGNMHAVPLVYFRTKKPMDITSFEQINYMTGQNEARATYPIFMYGPDNQLVFHYRDGSSGSGNEIYNVYNTQTKSWCRLLDQPLTDGRGLMNAYIGGPVLGSDNRYHIVWVWRDTPDCSTNHHLSYARSSDLKTWENAAGKPVELPITLEQTSLYVDPIPVGGGIINGAAKIGFDRNNRLFITYHKNDKAGNTQAYITRWNKNKWESAQLSDWSHKWDFKGNGSINFEISIDPPQLDRDGLLRVAYKHIKYGSGYWLVDSKTLKVVGQQKLADTPTRSSHDVESAAVVMTKRAAADSGCQLPSDVKYSLEWETLPANRDTLRTGITVTPSVLKLVEKR